MNWDEILEDEGRRWRAAMALPEGELERLLQGTMARLGDGLAVREALDLLGNLLEPLCGAGAARSAMAAAEQQTGKLCGGTWRRFVFCLSELIGSICGAAAGRLVDQAGLSLEVA